MDTEQTKRGHILYVDEEGNLLAFSHHFVNIMKKYAATSAKDA